MDNDIKKAIAAGKKLLRAAQEEADRLEKEKEEKEKKNRALRKKRAAQWVKHTLPATITSAIATQKATPMGWGSDVSWAKDLSKEGELWSFDLRSLKEGGSNNGFSFDIGKEISNAINATDGLASYYSVATPTNHNYPTEGLLRIAFVFSYKK